MRPTALTCVLGTQGGRPRGPAPRPGRMDLTLSLRGRSAPGVGTRGDFFFAILGRASVCTRRAKTHYSGARRAGSEQPGAVLYISNRRRSVTGAPLLSTGRPTRGMTNCASRHPRAGEKRQVDVSPPFQRGNCLSAPICGHADADNGKEFAGQPSFCGWARRHTKENQGGWVIRRSVGPIINPPGRGFRSSVCLALTSAAQPADFYHRSTRFGWHHLPRYMGPAVRGGFIRQRRR